MNSDDNLSRRDRCSSVVIPNDMSPVDSLIGIFLFSNCINYKNINHLLPNIQTFQMNYN